MKISIAFLTKYGNGKTCAESLERILRAKGHDARAFSIRDIKPKDLPESDIYIFSTPTHAGTAPFKMKGFLRKFQPPKEGAKYALITTRAAPTTKSLGRMDEVLKPKGMTRITAGLEIVVKGMKGPLEDGYEKKIEDLAAKIVGQASGL